MPFRAKALKGESKHGLLLASSNKDAFNFFTSGIKKPTSAFSLITGSSESMLDKFNEQEIQDQEVFTSAVQKSMYKTFRIGSNLSTVSVGLNLPEHVFIVAAANIYRPLSTYWKYGSIDLIDARCYEANLALQQAIGRNARKSSIEAKLGENANTSRIALISKAGTFPNIVENLASYSENFYDNVFVIDLTPIEDLLSKNFKSKKLISGFSHFLNYLKQESPLYPIVNAVGPFESQVDIRFNFVKELYGIYSDKKLDMQEICIRYIKFCNNFKIFSLISQLAMETVNTIIDVEKTSQDGRQMALEKIQKDFPQLSRNLSRKLNLDRLKRESEFQKETVSVILEKHLEVYYYGQSP